MVARGGNLSGRRRELSPAFSYQLVLHSGRGHLFARHSIGSDGLMIINGSEIKRGHVFCPL